MESLEEALMKTLAQKKKQKKPQKDQVTKVILTPHCSQKYSYCTNQLETCSYTYRFRNWQKHWIKTNEICATIHQIKEKYN